MKNAFINVYREARKLVDDNRVFLTAMKNEEHKTTLYFNCDEKEVRLELTRLEVGRQYKRNWQCTCHSYALLQERVDCKHMIACLIFLSQE